MARRRSRAPSPTWAEVVPEGTDPLAPSGYLDECIDLLETPWWRLAAFRLNGWPRLPVDPTEQAWRPWHRWWGRRDR